MKWMSIVRQSVALHEPTTYRQPDQPDTDTDTDTDTAGFQVSHCRQKHEGLPLEGPSVHDSPMTHP